MSSVKISNNMLERMPVYLNYLNTLPKSTKNISATKIASALGLGEVSVRKDLAKVSDGGRCKLGYSCKELIKDIECFLGLQTTMGAVIVAKGETLQVLLNYEGFENAGLNIVAGFDMDDDTSVRSSGKIYSIRELERVCKDQDIQIGILMVSPEEAQGVCDQLVSVGVQGIWNFTPMYLKVPEHIVLQNESFTASITKMRMQLNDRSAVF